MQRGRSKVDLKQPTKGRRMQLEQLCGDLLRAKQAENDARDKRIAIEQAITDIVGIPEEGTKTTDAEGYKVKVDQRIKRTIDAKAWALVRDQIPEELRPIKIVEEIKVENKGVLWLKEKEQGYYRLLCQAMTEKPEKPSVKVEEV